MVVNQPVYNHHKSDFTQNVINDLGQKSEGLW